MSFNMINFKLMKYYFQILIFIIPISTYSQSNLKTILKSVEIIVSGLSFIKGNDKSHSNAKTIESVCIENNLTNILISNGFRTMKTLFVKLEN